MARIRALVSAAIATAAAALTAQDRGRPEFPYTMDFGPCMTTTLLSRGTPGVTEKALVVRLPDGAFAFDTELLRMSAFWTDGWLELRGTAYDGAHGPMPRIRGRVAAACAPKPGIALGSDLADPRQAPYGPLPKAWGSYDGHWLCGDKVVFGYHAGDMAVVELGELEHSAHGVFAVRRFEFAPSASEHTFVVLDGPDGATTLPVPADASGAAAATVLQWQPRVPEPVETDVSRGDWSQLSIGAPSEHDYLDSSSGTGAVIEFVPGFRRPQGSRAPAAGSPEDKAALQVPVLMDGKAAAADDDRDAMLRFQNGDGDARLHVDLQRAVDVSRVSVFSRAGGDRAVQRYELFGSDADAVPPLDAGDPARSGWREIAEVNTSDLGQGGMQGSSVARKDGVGHFRHLLFVLRNAGCLLTEIDVYADRFRAAVDGSGRPALCGGAVVRGGQGPTLVAAGGRILLRVPAHQSRLRCRVATVTGSRQQVDAMQQAASADAADVDLAALVSKGDTARWGAPIVTKGERGKDDGPFAVDTIAIPFENRFGSRMRTAAFDFFRDGRAAISTWNGDVWIVSGIDDALAELKWQRFATGLYDPLGLAIVGDVVYVHGRDGITRLRDRNGDGEADSYECFNHDVEVTNAFHEFAFDLQTDPDGNFYCAKAGPVNPGGRGFMTIAAHHGTIMKIAKDGSSLAVIATGLRAPNGIGVSPDGSIVTSGDNEGTWMPRCRINWITRPGYYAGVRDTAHRRDVPDQPDRPLCWLPMEVDNSSGGQVWVTSKAWAPQLQGRLLHLSYGTSSVYLVLKEDIDGVVQGGVVRLPCEFTSSAMRARFSPKDGQLYVAGLQGWQTNAARLGGFHRVRFTGKPLHLPLQLRTCERGVYLTFAEPLDGKTAADPASYGVEIWNYHYSQNYGSPEISLLHPERKVEQGKPNRDALPITKATLSPDGRTVFLAVDGMRPVMQMKVTYNVDAQDGAPVKGDVHATIHVLTPDPGFPAAR